MVRCPHRIGEEGEMIVGIGNAFPLESPYQSNKPNIASNGGTFMEAHA